MRLVFNSLHPSLSTSLSLSFSSLYLHKIKHPPRRANKFRCEPSQTIIPCTNSFAALLSHAINAPRTDGDAISDKCSQIRLTVWQTVVTFGSFRHPPLPLLLLLLLLLPLLLYGFGIIATSLSSCQESQIAKSSPRCALRESCEANANLVIKSKLRSQISCHLRRHSASSRARL